MTDTNPTTSQAQLQQPLRFAGLAPIRAWAHLLAAAALAVGCASSPDRPSAASNAEEPPLWKQEAQRTAGGISKAADVVGRKTGEYSAVAGDAAGKATVAMGRSIGTAFRGVTSGFETADPTGDYGKAPTRYIGRIRSHFSNILRVSDGSSFKFGSPERGYMNTGILRGGDISWRGYLVEVEVAEKGLLSSGKPRRYVVRMRDGEIVEVHPAARAREIKRVSEGAP